MAPSGTFAAAVSRPPVVAGLGAAAIALALWAAAVPRPVRAILRPGRTGPDTSAPPFDQQLGGGEVADKPVTGNWVGAEGALSTVLAWATVLAMVVVALVAAVLVVRALVQEWRQRQLPPEADPSMGPDLDSLVLAVTDDSEGRLDALAAGSPGQGIIKAWVRLEETLSDAGVVLASSRTSTEVALDVLHRFDVDRESLSVLADLYREARFSRHDLTEDDRARAETAYRALDASLRSAVPRGQGARRG